MKVHGALVFATGVLFAVGLGISGMTEPAKVVGFLDFTGAWDPSLAFVMLGAVGVHLFLFRLITGRAAPLFAPRFAIPTRGSIDTALLAGAAIFGLGWGLGGYCPAPAIVSAGARSSPALIMTVSMAVGIAAYEGCGYLRKRTMARPAGEPA
jgi:uncharacterized membrane protein YedE/YeeE